MYKVDQKAASQTHGRNSVKSSPIYKKITERFLSKFAVKGIFKISPHVAFAATLRCETLMSAKQAINDKLQGIFCSCIFKVWWSC